MSGPKPLPPEQLKARGTEKPTRQRHNVVPYLDGEIVIPAWVKGRARKLFVERCNVYARRRQVIAGCEESLAHYCCLMASVEDRRRKGVDVTASEMGQLRTWAHEFYDTPASQVAKGPAPDKDNPFAKRGTPPPPQ